MSGATFTQCSVDLRKKGSVSLIDITLMLDAVTSSSFLTPRRDEDTYYVAEDGSFTNSISQVVLDVISSENIHSFSGGGVHWHVAEFVLRSQMPMRLGLKEVVLWIVRSSLISLIESESCRVGGLPVLKYSAVYLN